WARRCQGGRVARNFRGPVADGATPTQAPTCPAAVAVAAPDRIFRRPHRRPHPQVSRVGRGAPAPTRTSERLAVTFNWTKRLSVRPQSSRCPHPLSKASVEGFDHRIVNLRPYASNRIVLARRVHAVGQQDNIEVALPVD